MNIILDNDDENNKEKVLEYWNKELEKDELKDIRKYVDSFIYEKSYMFPEEDNKKYLQSIKNNIFIFKDKILQLETKNVEEVTIY